MFNKFFISFVISFALFGCNEKYTIIAEQVNIPNKKKLVEDSLLRDSVFNFEFSRLTKPNSHGLESVFKVSDEYKNKKLRIVFWGKVRTNAIYSKSTITLAALNEENNNVLIWKAVFLNYYYTELNTWCWFKDSMDVPSSFDNKKYSYINTFAYLGDVKNEKFDMDTLFVTVKCKL